jgi:hypothetical protein
MCPATPQGDLLDAVKAGDAEKVKQCLDAGVDLSCQDQVRGCGVVLTFQGGKSEQAQGGAILLAATGPDPVHVFVHAPCTPQATRAPRPGACMRLYCALCVNPNTLNPHVPFVKPQRAQRLQSAPAVKVCWPHSTVGPAPPERSVLNSSPGVLWSLW